MARKSEQPRARTAEERTQQIISKAYDLVEQRINEGTASSAELVHFLRMGSAQYQAQQEALKAQAKLAQAKAESLDRAKQNEADAQQAIEALKSYSPSND